MIIGLGTAIYPVPDLAAAKEWYAKLAGHDPYFDEPFYVGFAVGGFELGLIPDGVPGASGVAAYWRVSDAAAEMARLLALGASPHEPVIDVGGGIKAGSVLDPFGNVFSIIENPHFDPKQVR
jgi:predicted enzyme related to lactoylglutathione lyase